MSRDVTDTVGAEEALAAAKEEAERANAAKSEFMSRMSHELRTPLNSVLGFAQILQMELESQEDLELVDHVYKSGQHLLTLINEVLDISRVESGNIGLRRSRSYLHEVVAECLDIIGPQAKERGVGIERQRLLRLLVTADQLRLKQVILNLLSNAIKYNRKHGSVTLQCDEGRLRSVLGDRHRLRHRAGLRERLFIAFDRLDAETRGIEGTGLGLTLSKTLVEAMGGHPGLRDRGGRRFDLLVRIAPLRWRARGIVSMTPKTREEDERPMATILYIEDNLYNVQLVERLLLQRPTSNS